MCYVAAVINIGRAEEADQAGYCLKLAKSIVCYCNILFNP